MRKRILTLAIAIVSICTVSAFAAPGDKKECKENCKTENVCKKDKCDKDKCDKKDKCCKKDKCDKKDKCNKKDKCKKDKKCDKKCKDGKQRAPKDGKKARMDRRPGFGSNPALRGIQLSDEQQTKVAALEQKIREEKAKAENIEREAREKVHKNYEQEILNILTPEQKEVYQKNIERIKSKKVSNRGERFQLRELKNQESMQLAEPQEATILK